MDGIGEVRFEGDRMVLVEREEEQTSTSGRQRILATSQTRESLVSIDKEATIPCFDLDAGNELRADLVKRFGDGLRDVGFVAVKAEKLASIVSDVNKEMEAYFHQSKDMKMKDWHNNDAQTGFSPYGNETAAGRKAADLKETFFVAPNMPSWPASCSNFENVMKRYHQDLSEIAVQVMTILHEYLGEPTDEVRGQIESAHNLLRLAHYFPPEGDDSEAVWAAAHEDLNALTLLPPSTVPGLELMTKEGKWMPVVVPEGYLIVNTGELVESVTAGMIKATRHQVVNPGGKWAQTERFASIFFASWASDKSIKPLESCVQQQLEKGMPRDAIERRYPDVTVLDNLFSRLIEMGTKKDYDEAMVKGLVGKGLLRNPPEELKTRFPDLFKS